ncbi:fluoride efflux transporter CrcB [Brucella anthropi]|uniref:fluoride efflux transporter CrcB n=1 Tax=Brucella anthropi TaxID=529 RepID=UPI000774E9D3|nr:fluoride efflux transporter CrcB [Brucella anthropi]KXO78461.1 protein CrcB [Brucella anthropi]
MQATIMVALGGAIGSVARYWLALLMLPVSRELPWGTIVINIVGSFAISFFGALTLEQGRFPLPEIWRIAFMVGVCGGFTTFSSFSLQTMDLLRAGQPGKALFNIGFSVVLCLITVWLGLLAAERFNGGIEQVAQNAIEEEAS